MNRTGIVVFGAALAASLCYAQDATTPTAQGRVVGHGSFPVKVVKTLDSSKLKEGDAVEVATAGAFKLADGTMVPKGTKLTGHITAAKARSKGDSDSELTLAFERINIPGGKQIPIKGMVQAVFPPEEEVEPNMAGKATNSGGGSSLGGGDVGTVTNARTGSNMDSSAGDPGMSPKSAGVEGMHGLELKDGVLTSKGKNVKLGDGVRMIVRVEILG